MTYGDCSYLFETYTGYAGQAAELPQSTCASSSPRASAGEGQGRRARRQSADGAAVGDAPVMGPFWPEALEAAKTAAG